MSFSSSYKTDKMSMLTYKEIWDYETENINTLIYAYGHLNVPLT